MTSELHCWRCRAALPEEPLPLAREARCRGCGADLHACRGCRFHAQGIANECREPVAERVVDKTRANFCGWFAPRTAVGEGPPAQDAARAALDSLFEGPTAPASPTTPEAARSALDDLFGG